jgi:hypothetical protein
VKVLNGDAAGAVVVAVVVVDTPDADTGVVVGAVVGVKLNGFGLVAAAGNVNGFRVGTAAGAGTGAGAGAGVDAGAGVGLKVNAPAGVDVWGAGHVVAVVVAALANGLGPGAGVDTSGVVVTPGQLVGRAAMSLLLLLVVVAVWARRRSCSADDPRCSAMASTWWMVPCAAGPLLMRSVTLDGRNCGAALGRDAAAPAMHWPDLCADEPHLAHTCLWRHRTPKRHRPLFQCEHAFSTPEIAGGAVVGVCVVSRVVNDDACAFSVEFHGFEACPAADTPCVGLLGLPNPPNGDAGAAPDCPGSLVVVDACTPPNGRAVAAVPNDPKGLTFAVAPKGLVGAPPNTIVSRMDAIRGVGACCCVPRGERMKRYYSLEKGHVALKHI